MTRFLSLLGLLSLCVVPTTLAKDAHLELSHLQHQIHAARQVLQTQQGTLEDEQEQLKTTETKLAGIYSRVQGIKKQKAILQAKIKELERQQRQDQAQVELQYRLLSMQLVAIYRMGHEPYLKMLLGQEDLRRFSRNLIYYHYWMQDRERVIQSILKLLNALKKTQEALLALQQDLSATGHALDMEKAGLEKAQQARKTSIKRLNQSIQTEDEQLAVLLKNKKKLEQTLAQLAAANPFRYQGGIAFSRLRGRLHWPILGKLLESFDTQRQQSELKWGGVVVAAPQGTSVHAVADGRVIFANWLAGYGFLLIVDQGEGFMTLYGRNQVLYKKKDDLVAAGEVVATVGKTGGFSTAGLYFAIRDHGRPIDPALWCS